MLKQEERATEGDGDALATASVSLAPMAVALAQGPHLKTKHDAARSAR
jgi:hypothetical protein